MQVKSGFVLNELCGETFLVPMGEENMDFSKLIDLNESSLLLWKRMVRGDFSEKDLVEVLLKEYDVDEEIAHADVRNLIEQLKKENVIKD